MQTLKNTAKQNKRAQLH